QLRSSQPSTCPATASSVAFRIPPGGSWLGATSPYTPCLAPGIGASAQGAAEGASTEGGLGRPLLIGRPKPERGGHDRARASQTRPVCYPRWSSGGSGTDR